MSVPVPVDRIAEAARPFGAAAFVVAGAGDGPPSVLHAVVRIEGDRLHIRVGRRMAAALAANPALTVLWPPADPGEMSLVVDAVVIDGPGPDGGRLEARATGAVRHRPAPVDVEVQPGADAG